MGRVKNFARFYACLKTVQTVNKEELKESLVSQFTSGRTTSLREITQKEYDAMCDSIDNKLKYRDDLRRRRRDVLHRMQRIGINTTDWNVVDEYCLDSRIAGKVFRLLTVGELDKLFVKLIAIELKKKKNKKEFQRSLPQKSELTMILANGNNAEA